MNRCLLSLCLLTLFTLTSAPSAHAQRFDTDKLKSGKDFRSLFKSVINDARKWTVRVNSDGEQVALGTVVDSAGLILTKASQLEGPVVVQLDGGKHYTADVLGISTDYDIAMLKIDADELTAISWSDEKPSAVGSWVVTPGLDELPTAVGIVSVLSRQIPAERGVLGISIEEVSSGLKITRIHPKSGADRAGLKVEDVVLSISKIATRRLPDLTGPLRKLRPGDSTILTVQRGLQTFDTKVTLRTPPQSDLSRGAIQNRLGGALSLRRTGFPAVFQHDSVIRPQDCGGPLLDLDGKAIGLNIARAGRTETYAISVDAIQKLLSPLKNGQLIPRKPERFWMSTPPAPPLPE